ncbi:hypothetical protein ACIBCB_04580 [Streptomyces uncialis]|uniref:hypothetical protein n=1 Tax=Streptomyces uncialis TaxID=1048205 RepID=UPI0037A95A9D
MEATPAISATPPPRPRAAIRRFPRRATARGLTPWAVLTALTLTATGCVTVHGEREIIPAATKAEADRALGDFLTAYNKADRANDPALDEDRVTGALGAIDQAGLRARRSIDPDGDPNRSPLELTDRRFTVPKMAGWPKFFLADTDSNRDQDTDKSKDTRWVLAFTRGGPDAGWKAAYLTVMSPGQIPEFRTDGDGLASAVPVRDKELAVPPAELSERYATYLDKGGPDFAPGPHTTDWREERRRGATRPGLSRQYIDQPLGDGAYAPLGLRTEDGGALVFFATRHYEKQTAAKGRDLRLEPPVRALMRGAVKQSVTLERTSNQAVRVPVRGASGGGVLVLSRIQGLTGAKGD